MSKHVGFLYSTAVSLVLVTFCLVYAAVKLEARVEKLEWQARNAQETAEEANARAAYANRVAMRSLEKQVLEPCLIDGDKVAVTECELDVFGARVCRLNAMPIP